MDILGKLQSAGGIVALLGIVIFVHEFGHFFVAKLLGMRVFVWIEEGGGVVLDREHARIDQLAGVALALAEGYRNIAVTVADPETAEIIHRIHPDTLIFAVHVTGISAKEAEKLVSASDLVTACASKTIREIAGAGALLQAGISVPIFAMTQKGKLLIIEKIRQSDEPVLVKPTRLQARGDNQPSPLV